MLYDKVIFVCRDNICQSPAAVTILNSIKKDEWLEVSSRGLVVLFSEPYSMKIHSLLRNHGIIMDNGVSRPLEEKDFGENTIILTMTRAQKDKILSEYKNACNVYSIMEFAGGNGDIFDPYGGDNAVYEMFYSSIHTWVNQVEIKLHQLNTKEDLKMIALGSDHGGFALKSAIIKHLENRGLEYKDYGCYNTDSRDYPVFGRAAAEAVADGTCDKGIVVCTTGIGISIAANKVKGIRCALCTSTNLAKMTRLHNNANMLALGASVVSEELAMDIVDTFLDTEFSNEERHIRRVEMIEK